MAPDDAPPASNRRIRASRVLGLALAVLLSAGEVRAACSVDYAVTSDWGSGFIASVAILIVMIVPAVRSRRGDITG